MNSAAPEPIAVRRRRVFYISGFDPRGPAHYHKLYREECAKQSQVNGMTVTIGPRRQIDGCETAWDLTAGDVESVYSFLRWDDLVRTRWARTSASIYRDIVRYAWGFLRRGVFAMILRNGWPTFVTAAYPPALLFGLAVLAVVIALVARYFLAGWLGGWGNLIALAIVLLPFAFRKQLEAKLNAFWLARGCAFLVDRGGGKTPDIEERCARFAERIARAAADQTVDEVLVTSHSVGTHLAITTLARALEQMPATARLSFLTIGQTIAMAACQPAASQMRADLLAVATAPQIRWFDVSSPADSTCIPLTDPLKAAGIARPAGAVIQPKLISARFVRMFTPEGYKAVRRKFIRVHFQYLMAAELPGDYDYFLITAGDITLADRYRDHASVTDFNRLRVRLP